MRGKIVWFFLETNKNVFAKCVNLSASLHAVTCMFPTPPLHLVFHLEIFLDGVRIKVLEAFHMFATFFEVIYEMCLHNNLVTALLKA